MGDNKSNKSLLKRQFFIINWTYRKGINAPDIVTKCCKVLFSATNTSHNTVGVFTEPIIVVVTFSLIVTTKHLY